MKEAKDARYTNGHLFTTISVSGMTMCYACNKSITAKEALICPSKLDPERRSDSPLPICPFSAPPGSLSTQSTRGVPPARARGLLPCSLFTSQPRGGGSRTMAPTSRTLWERGGGRTRMASRCSCHPLGVPGSLNSWGTDGRRSKECMQGQVGAGEGSSVASY